MEKIMFRAEIPYIGITEKCGCKNSVYRLKELLASPKGEMTAVNKYVYCAAVLKKENPEVSGIFEEIAKVEMHHMNMIMQLLISSGEYPVYSCENYCSGRRKEVFWSAGFIKYNNNLKNMLISFLNDESGAASEYMSLADSCENEEMAAVLKRIAMDEKIHCKILTDLFEKYK